MSEAKTTKQSIYENLESSVNRLLLANLWLDSKCNNLLIQFWGIDFLCLLDSRDLDCHENSLRSFSRNDAMTAWGDSAGISCESAIHLAMTNR